MYIYNPSRITYVSRPALFDSKSSSLIGIVQANGQVMFHTLLRFLKTIKWQYLNPWGTFSFPWLLAHRTGRRTTLLACICVCLSWTCTLFHIILQRHLVKRPKPLKATRTCTSPCILFYAHMIIMSTVIGNAQLYRPSLHTHRTLLILICKVLAYMPVTMLIPGSPWPGTETCHKTNAISISSHTPYRTDYPSHKEWQIDCLMLALIHPYPGYSIAAHYEGSTN